MIFVGKFSDLIHRRVIPVVFDLHEFGLRLRTNMHLLSLHWRGYVRVLNLWYLNLVVAFRLWNVNFP